MKHSYDAIVLGSGLAGLSVALRLADGGRQVALISKRELKECNSFYAQGGIAAVINQQDSFSSHIQDTLIAGAGLCKEQSVKFIVENAPEQIDWLINIGVEFTKENEQLHLTREGGHSARRVLHVADATGAAIIQALISKVTNNPNIKIYEQFIGIDLILSEDNSCQGLYVLDSSSGVTHTFCAPNVILATGGAGKAYLYTTNPDVATGDGIAMAYRSGAKVANLEFIQFHPTCLYHEKAKSFLISEAVRGEGGILQLADGQRFMHNHDQRLELAPRDVVARAIDFEMKKHGLDSVFLDISHQPKEFILEHFPNIYAKCLSLGIDISYEPIPVVPAAHYTCGGIVTDLVGRTGIEGLYAVGECAHTGLHGANRLASNSLLECLVIGNSLVEDIIKHSSRQVNTQLPLWDETLVTNPDEEIVIAHNWDELRRLMWDYVGIVRSDKRLARALRRVSLLREEIDEYYASYKITADVIELRNLILVAELIIRCAQMRKESR
ncbi:MAG: hypothetical protein RLZZ293_405, partial [Pseudomonadota bacterium]